MFEHQLSHGDGEDWRDLASGLPSCRNLDVFYCKKRFRCEIDQVSVMVIRSDPRVGGTGWPRYSRWMHRGVSGEFTMGDPRSSEDALASKVGTRRSVV